MDLDLANSANEVQQLYVSHSFERGAVRAGRIFLAGCYATPAPFLFKTARYPTSAFTMSAYAYGVQWAGDFGPFSVIADVSGNSNRVFDETGQFGRAEFSARVAKAFGSNHIAGDTEDRQNPKQDSNNF